MNKRKSSDSTFEVEVAEVLKETDMAILVKLETGDEIWIPKSQIHDDSEVWKSGHTGTLVIPEWLATEKGLT